MWLCSVSCRLFFSGVCVLCVLCFFFFKQKTAYEMRISDWGSDVCSSDLQPWDDYSAAQDAMGMTPDRIPKFSELNEVLREATGWTLMGVEGLDRKSVV